MNWIIRVTETMEEDYGKVRWMFMTDEEQMRVVAEFLHNYFNAIEYLKKVKLKP